MAIRSPSAGAVNWRSVLSTAGRSAVPPQAASAAARHSASISAPSLFLRVGAMAALLSAGNGRQTPGGESPAGTENLSGRFSERSGQRIFQTVKRKTIAKGQKCRAVPETPWRPTAAAVQNYYTTSPAK